MIIPESKAATSCYRSGQFPAQIDVTHLGFEMRVSDPYLVLTGLAPDSFLNEFGLRVGDAIATVNGENFDTIADFAALTKRQKDMVLEIFHEPDVSAFFCFFCFFFFFFLCQSVSPSVCLSVCLLHID